MTVKEQVKERIQNLAPDEEIRIRKFTPRECFRLMDVSEPDIDKLCSSGVSNSQLYKQAGNSIVVSVLYYAFKNLFITPSRKKRIGKLVQTEPFPNEVL